MVVNNLLAGTVAGIAGAASVNVAHEVTRQITPRAPRVDVIGMRALASMCTAAGFDPPEHLRTATLAGDMATNSLYYSLVALGGAKGAVAAGGALGALGGIAGLVLPPRMNLGDAEVNRTPATQAMTIAFYLAGGLVAGLTYRLLAKR